MMRKPSLNAISNGSKSQPRLRNILLLTGIIVASLSVLVACQPQSPAVVEVPTLIVLPSATDTLPVTPSDTPTNTLVITNTPTPTLTATLTGTPPEIATSLALAASSTPTSTGTFTPTFTSTVTATSTASFTATSTATPSRTFTATVTRTFTRTIAPPTNTPTPTLTPTATLALPVIQTFASNTTSASPGATVIFSWTAQGDTARIDQLTPQGAVVQTFPIPVSGQLPVVLPINTTRQIVYRLAVQRVGQEVTQNIVINVLCPIAYFFGDQFAPTTSACPGGQPLNGSGAFQFFQNGVMIYVNASLNGTPINKIYGLTNDSLYVAFTNNWDGTTFRDETEPSGAFDPLQMFNWAYYNTLAPIGGWNSAIGWGITSIDTGNRTIQYEGAVGGTNPFYIDGPNGVVYRFSGGDSGSWTRIK